MDHRGNREMGNEVIINGPLKIQHGHLQLRRENRTEKIGRANLASPGLRSSPRGVAS